MEQGAAKKYEIPQIDIECQEFFKNNKGFGIFERHEYHFENGYGASVINNEHSYGLELAVLERNNKNKWNLTYLTPITDDVVGFIDEKEELKKLLEDIKKLK